MGAVTTASNSTSWTNSSSPKEKKEEQKSGEKDMFFSRCFRESLGKEHLPIQNSGSMRHKNEASHYRAEKKSKHPGWWKTQQQMLQPRSQNYRVNEVG